MYFIIINVNYVLSNVLGIVNVVNNIGMVFVRRLFVVQISLEFEVSKIFFNKFWEENENEEKREKNVKEVCGFFFIGEMKKEVVKKKKNFGLI